MTIRQMAFTRFRHSSKGVSSRYNKKIVSVIFKCIDQMLAVMEKPALTIEAIYPFVEENLKANHIAVLKKDLTDIIIEILDFLIEDCNLTIYDSYFDDTDTELKKALWPYVSKLNDPEILDILIDEIFNELDQAVVYTAEDLADRLSKNRAFKNFTFNELFDISETALLKLEDLNFLVE